MTELLQWLKQLLCWHKYQPIWYDKVYNTELTCYQCVKCCKSKVQEKIVR